MVYAFVWSLAAVMTTVREGRKSAVEEAVVDPALQEHSTLKGNLCFERGDHFVCPSDIARQYRYVLRA